MRFRKCSMLSRNGRRSWLLSSWNTFRATGSYLSVGGLLPGQYSTRTNNDAEGLHHLWNTGYNGSLVPFYALVAKIAGISKTVETEMRLVAADKLTRRQRPADSRKTEILFQIWNKISEGLLEPLEAHQCFMQMNTWINVFIQILTIFFISFISW